MMGRRDRFWRSLPNRRLFTKYPAERTCWRVQESSNPPLDEQATTRYVITRGVVTVQDPTILILASLADGDKHGYAIMEDIQVFAGIRLGPGTLRAPLEYSRGIIPT